MSDSATFGETGNIQSFTVSVSGDYVITAEGATGGSVAAGDAGGAGAEVTGTFYLNAGDTLDILVGEVGANGTSSSGGGGGGGTFIYDATTATLLEAAGGGGGASEGDNLTGVPGDPGQAGNADGGGVRGGAAGTTISAAGAGNHPVGMPNDGNGNGYSYGGGGGGGFAYDGQSTQGVDQGYGGGGGESFLDALSGSTLPYGQGGDAHGDGGDGGYGGGGGGQYFYGGGGGGGGYTGGGGGGGGVTDYGYGGGGGSYDAGSNATLTTGVNASGNGLAMIDPEMQCFVSGTRILGAEGDVLVEDIRVGNRLITALNGAAEVAEVVWVGRRAVDISRHPEPGLVRPVCIMAGAIAPGLPERDLYVSPHHALYIDGALFEAISLVNGISILQPARGGTVTYHHIALAGHGIILAEAMPAETFLDTGGKGDFMDGQVASLHPRFAASAEAVRCAELVLHGPELEQLRARIRARALAIAA